MKNLKWSERLLVALGFHLLQLWTRTLRFQLEDGADLGKISPNEPRIWAIWHNRVLLFPAVMRRFAPHREGAALISASRDGALLAEFVARFGYSAVRGSSSKKGASAVRQLSEVMARGEDLAITPDGPRGPAYELGSGIVYLAQNTGAAVMPLNLEYSGCWRLTSWDRFVVPKPFTTVRVKYGPPHHVRPTATDAEFEEERLRLQNAMMQLVENP
ncbi:MAG: lysophospholipid acyltransferase family protein [Chthoniobacterales bacterium]